MGRLELKEYQHECLGAIRDYCEQTRTRALAEALRPERDAFEVVTGRGDYYAPDAFAGTPYVCLRVPTGGGKTLIAAHAVGTIARHLGHMDRPLCLWVTPTTTIRDQTIKGLRNREHPYYEALGESLGTSFQVLTIGEAQQASKAMMASDAVVIVTTIQAYRIDKTDNRKIYDDNGYLMDHFDNLPGWVRERLKEEDGQVRLSLANAMKLRGPIVIMDEAHNARSKTSFDSLARFGPLAVLELTATPQHEHNPEKEKYASNVLHAVSAVQLKNEGMIKLPVELESRADWLEVLAVTIERRMALAASAAAFEKKTGRSIRPIALIQAQNKSTTHETHTAEAVKAALIDPDGPFKLSPDSVRIDIGTINEVGDADLSDPACPIEYVITVNKLREGWDCPFAYVLGSIGNVSTPTAVEQILGRVLRMPHATPTGIPELDRAYAIVQSENILETAKSLRDGLVKQCGFDANSVDDSFRVVREDTQHTLPATSIPMSEPPDTKTLPDAVRLKVEYNKEARSLLIRGALDREQTQALRDAAQTLQDRNAVETFFAEQRTYGTAAKKLDEYAEPLRIPQLVVRDGSRVTLFDPIELDEFAWDLDTCDPVLTDQDFALDWRAGSQVTIGPDTTGGTTIGPVTPVMVTQLALLDEGEDWSRAELVRWCNTELHRGQRFLGLTALQSLAWLNRVIDALVNDRDADMSILVRKRHELADVVIARVAAHGRSQVRQVAELLIAGTATTPLETSYDLPCVIEEDRYAPYHTYAGAFSFAKHAFDKIAAMNTEETECAKRIDDHHAVTRWVRNLEHESAGGFSLPLSPGRFFPDFIGELVDGRVALIEYKGGHLAMNPKELHKKAVGELWARQSQDRGVFVWVANKDWDTLARALEPEDE